MTLFNPASIYYEYSHELTTMVNQYCDDNGQVASISTATSIIALMGSVYCLLQTGRSLQNLITSPQPPASLSQITTDFFNCIIFGSYGMALTIASKGFYDACN